MIYVPDIEHYECFTMHDNYIRAYHSGVNEIGDYVPYTDYYYNSNYYSNNGFELIEKIPVCLPADKLTTEVYYRVDFYKILIIFFILAFIIFYVPLRILFKFFKKR